MVPCKSYDTRGSCHNEMNAPTNRGRARAQHGTFSSTHPALQQFLESSVSDLTIRLARPEDREDVFEISSSVWEGNDYVPLVWDEWLAEAESDGFVTIGELNGRVIALQHVELQAGGVAWVEGIRVHERFRNRGVAGRLLTRALEQAADGGARLARLAVSSQNEASKAVVTKAGFRMLDSFYSFTAPAVSESELLQPDAASIARVEHHRFGADVERRPVTGPILQTVRAAAGGDDHLVVTHGWTAQTVPGQVSPEEFGLGLVFAGDPPGALLANVQSRRNRLNLAFVGGQVPVVRRLGLVARFEAARLGLESAGGMMRRQSGGGGWS